MPITEFKDSMRLKRFRRTSDDSSRRRAKKIYKTWSFVAFTPTIGAIANKFSARAYLTY